MRKTVQGLAVVFGVTLLFACSSSSIPQVAPQGSPARDLLNRDIPEIAAALSSGSVSSTELVLAYQQRIASIDKSGPMLRAVLSLDPGALDRARMLDAQRAAGVIAGPLHGVPILLKDNIEAAGALPTTAGSIALINNVTNRDSPLVTGLRNAGAIILGKTNLSEWANYRSNFSLSGWSAVGGQVRNPHILDRNPCGSSSGSGVAVAAGLAAGAVGTETNGSIICPSNVNGVVGFKPTVGLVSTQHIVPISPTQDTAGPMARSVMGAALMLDAMTGDASATTYSKNLNEYSLAGIRLGVLRYSVGDHPGINQRFDESLAALQALGAVLIEIDEAPVPPDNVGVLARQVMDNQFKESLNSYLAGSPANIATRSLEELIAFNTANADTEMPLFDQGIFEQANATKGLKEPNHQLALATITRATRDNGIDSLLIEHSVRALIFPSGPLAPRTDPINGDVWPNWVGAGSSAAIAGYPHLTVPMGTVHNLPIGLSFVASAHSDAEVLGLGYVFEQATKLRATPRFLPTAGAQPQLQRALEGQSGK